MAVTVDEPIDEAEPVGANELSADLRARIDELDAIAWNLPRPEPTPAPQDASYSEEPKAGARIS